MALSARLLLVLALIAISEGQENSTDLPSQETTSPETDFSSEGEVSTTLSSTSKPDFSLEEIINSTQSGLPDFSPTPQPVPSSTTKNVNNSSWEDFLPEGFAFNRSGLELGHYCTCDLTEGACDVNCCCDINCSLKDIKVFSECKDVKPFNLSPRYCYKTEIVVENNTQYLMEKVNNDPLFCIINANMEEGFTYLDREPIENVTYFEDMKSRHQAFIWPSAKATNDLPRDFNNTYKAGDPVIIITDDGELSHLSLPVPINSGRKCGAFSPIQYLKTEEYSCQVVLHQGSDCSAIQELNAANYVTGFRVLKRLETLLNHSIDVVVKMQQQALVILKPEVCINLNKEEKVCVETKLNEALSEPTKACENVLTKLKYEVYHDGAEGIKSIRALIEMTNFSPQLGEKPVVFSQSFGYTHYWSTDNVTSTLEERSGNPGYIVGKPIIAGVLSHKLDSEISLKDEPAALNAIVQSDLFIDRGFDETTQFLTIMSPKSANNCKGVQRQKIQFGINTRVGCVFFVTRKDLQKSCNQIRKEALDILLGNQLNFKRNKRNGRNSLDDQFGQLQLLARQRVAMFGNSKTTQPQDWIELLLTNVPNQDTITLGQNSNVGCRDVVTNLHIDVYYANVGSHANPQAKIIGVHYVFSTPQDISFRCQGLHCRHPNSSQPIEISTSVGFLDMTQPALKFYKEKPVLEAKLPHDFFYPFVHSPSVSNSAAASHLKPAAFLLVSLLYRFH